MTDIKLTRRELIVAGAVATGYAFAAQPVHAEAIATDAEGLVTGAVQIPVEGGAIVAYRAKPENPGELAPVVLVAHEIFGVHPYIQDVCRRFAKEGYCAIAPDLYSRVGNPATAPNVRTILTELVANVPDETVMSDLDATVKWAAENREGDTERLAANGFWWGGRMVWLYAAHSTQLRTGIAWYGQLEGNQARRSAISLVPELKAPVLGIYGTMDRGISVASVDEMRAAFKSHDSPSRIDLHKGGTSGFHADYRRSYHPRAAKAGWQATLRWLGEKV